MAWSKNNEAHRTLWAFVRIKHLRSDGTYPKFAEGEGWTTDFLLKHAPGEAPEMKRSKARKFALNFDGVARNFTGARQETGKDHNSATETMITALLDSSLTLGENIGDVADSVYQFLSEIDE